MKILWLISNIIIITYFSYSHATIHYDAAIPFIYLMLLITFPIGFIAPILLYFISFILPSTPVESPYSFIDGITIPGIIFIFLGYIQWFIIVPKVRSYLKR